MSVVPKNLKIAIWGSRDVFTLQSVSSVWYYSLNVVLFFIVFYLDELKQSITTHLLEMHKDPKWMPRLNQFHVTKFTSTSVDMYEEEGEIKKDVGNMSMNQQVYY